MTVITFRFDQNFKKMKDYTSILIPESTYHIYNRAHGKEKLFLSHENYKFFLLKYQQYIFPIANTFCYCLMPNHFHFLVQFKSENQLNLSSEKRNKNSSEFLSAQFNNMFNSYSKAFNKKYGRKGSLFMRQFKRKKIDDTDYLKKIIHYIHRNPVESELCNFPEEWKYSSYKKLISDYDSYLEKAKVISLFENKQNFIYVHRLPFELNALFMIQD
jgi:putative transposase